MRIIQFRVCTEVFVFFFFNAGYTHIITEWCKWRKTSTDEVTNVKCLKGKGSGTTSVLTTTKSTRHSSIPRLPKVCLDTGRRYWLYLTRFQMLPGMKEILISAKFTGFFFFFFLFFFKSILVALHLSVPYPPPKRSGDFWFHTCCSPNSSN